VPLVVTIHDLAVLRYPDTFNRWTRVYSRLLLPRLARAATRVIAVSEFTAREAVELLGVDERRVRVIPHGVDGPFAPEGLAANGEYLLAVGTVEPRKNHDRWPRRPEPRREELRAAGLDRAEGFTWEAAAKATAAGCREAADG
jgi:glycosyltransferase involved in cell wall biosynthesis